MAAAALSGAYQMALAELAAAARVSELLRQARVVVDLRAQIASLAADVMTTRTALTHAINEADRLRAELAARAPGPRSAARAGRNRRNCWLFCDIRVAWAALLFSAGKCDSRRHEKCQAGLVHSRLPAESHWNGSPGC